MVGVDLLKKHSFCKSSLAFGRATLLGHPQVSLILASVSFGSRQSPIFLTAPVTFFKVVSGNLELE